MKNYKKKLDKWDVSRINRQTDRISLSFFSFDKSIGSCQGRAVSTITRGHSAPFLCFGRGAGVVLDAVIC